MNSKTAGFIVAITVLLFGNTSAEECFISGECTNSLHLDIIPSDDEFKCLDLCKENSNCTWFTFAPASQICNLFANCIDIEVNICDACISGEQSCSQPEPICWISGECLGTEIKFEENVSTKEKCLGFCKITKDCKWFTYLELYSFCLLMADCKTLDETCAECISGESKCEQTPDEPAWHLIFGGNGLQGTYLKTVELYNWQTGEQCQLKDLPYGVAAHAGIVMDDIPAFCGGESVANEYIIDKRCFKLNKTDQSWIQISDLLSTTVYPGSALVPSQGWLIYGGASSTLRLSQKLMSLDGKWEAGPELFEGKSDEAQCIVQINDTTTGFFGGEKHPHGVTTFDWTTQQYTWHGDILQGERLYSSCALLKEENGNLVVAIASGRSSGIEAWNPIDGSVKMLNAAFPNLSGRHQTPKLISVNNGLELIFYETWILNAEKNKGIWKFHQSNSSWSKDGEMLFARDDFVALPVNDLTCD